MKVKTMRTINTHKVNPVNDKLEIHVLDEPGAGGASHRYVIKANQEKPGLRETLRLMPECLIEFQNGPIAENGVNGITQEALLAICIDRLQSFQKGPYSCKENSVALTHLETALLWLQKRTLERMQRGVEGTSTV